MKRKVAIAYPDSAVFTYDQLSDTAKENARDSMREGESEDFSSNTEYYYEPITTAATILGITFANANWNGTNRGYYEPDIRWSGFSCQGDGASFDGNYSNAPGAAVKIRSEFPKETRLHEIADELQALQSGYRLLTGGHFLEATITQHDGRYYSHSMSMDASVTDSETGEELEYDDINGCDVIAKKVLQLMRDFANWIYKCLQAEYDWVTSDESIEERLLDGDYEFDENGQRVY